MNNRRPIPCPEPWSGMFQIRIDGIVEFCPCYLRIEAGDINKQSISQIRNSEKVRYFRKAFRQGKIPPECMMSGCAYVLEDQKGRKA